MSNWRKNPPSEKEWLDQHNDGFWWVRFKINEAEEDIDEDGNIVIWPELWHNDIVQIVQEWGNGDRLIAKGFLIKEFYLDNPPDDILWQPVPSVNYD